MSDTFAVQIIPERERVRVVASGELDLITTDGLETTLRELLDRGFGHLLLDLRRLSFIDSRGLMTLLRVHARACELSTRLEVLSGLGQVTMLLHLTGLDALLDVAGPVPRLRRPNTRRVPGLLP